MSDKSGGGIKVVSFKLDSAGVGHQVDRSNSTTVEAGRSLARSCSNDTADPQASGMDPGQRVMFAFSLWTGRRIDDPELWCRPSPCVNAVVSHSHESRSRSSSALRFRPTQRLAMHTPRFGISSGWQVRCDGTLPSEQQTRRDRVCSATKRPSTRKAILASHALHTKARRTHRQSAYPGLSTYPYLDPGFRNQLSPATPPTAVRKEWCSLDERLFSGSCNTSSLANRQALSHYRHRLWSCIQLPYAPPWIHSVRLTRMTLARTRVRVKSEERAGGLLTLSGHGAVG